MSQPHDNPFGEAHAQLLQTLAVASTVGEAAARWAAVGIQNRAARAEQEATRDQAADAAQRQTARLAEQAVRQDRALIDKGLTGWLKHASVEETMRLWRTATVHAAAGNPNAAEAVHLAQERLRKMNEPLMNAYDRHRASGMGQAEAMKTAARDLWEAQARTYPQSPGRPHGGREPQQLSEHGPKELPAGGAALDELDAAVRREAGTLAAHISPEALDQLQRDWRAAGKAPAADAAGLLAQFAREASERGAMPAVAADALATSLTAQADTQRRAGVLDAATPDDQRTGVDEHQQGQARGEVHLDTAAAELAAAGARQRALMSQTFPALTSVGTVPGHVASKRPANAPTSTRSHGRTR